MLICARPTRPANIPVVTRRIFVLSIPNPYCSVPSIAHGIRSKRGRIVLGIKPVVAMNLLKMYPIKIPVHLQQRIKGLPNNFGALSGLLLHNGKLLHITYSTRHSIRIDSIIITANMLFVFLFFRFIIF